MAIHEPARYLICYDIADPRRLVRVHRCLRRRAMPLQYSVFLATITPADLDRLLEELATLIAPREDDVRAYRLPSNPNLTVLGPSALPEGVDLFDTLGKFPVGEQLEDSPDNG